MDVRLSPEQQALRDSVAQVADRLGPKAVGQLDDHDRAAKLDAAVTASGWRELRTAESGGSPLASGVEAAIVAEELGRGLLDVSFLGPTLAAELRRLAGAPPAQVPETIAVDGHLAALATSRTAELPAGVVIVDAGGADAALMLLDGPAGSSLASLSLEAASVTEPTDLTRPSVVAGPSIRLVEVADQTRPLRDDDLGAWTALGLALTCADLVGTMRGAVDLACEYASVAAPVRRGHRFLSGRPASAGRRLRGHGGLAQRGPARGLGRRCPPARRGAGRRGGGQGLLRPSGARGVRDGHPGARRHRQHLGVPGPRAPRVGRCCRATCSAARVRTWPACSTITGSELAMDFGDAPDEAEFRLRLRDWLQTNNPGLPTSSTDDQYWAGMAPWHQSLHDAGFFGMSWPKAIGGQDLPSVYDVILDEELAAAGAPPRPSLGYLVEGILAHANAEVQARFLPGIVNGRERWCQGFSEPDAGSDLASLRTRADRDGDEFVISGHKVWTSYSDDADWCLVLARTDHDVPKHKGISAFAVPMHQPGIEQRPLRMINGITKEFGEVIFDGARVPAADMIGEPRSGLGPGHDGGQPRARAGRARLRRSLHQAGLPARHEGARRAVGLQPPSRCASWAGPWWRRRCCDCTCAGACRTDSTASPTDRRDQWTSCS